ncbi:MAG TPA: pirin family protein [Planctomycetota bacterium]|nr:pirin family protein [Planctomycetota bacterium]
MSLRPTFEPECREPVAESLRVVVEARPRTLGGIPVGRALPARICRAVGPFVFLDEMGAARLAPGQGIDVPPHPHIGLATVTYLFDGEILHRDSLGSHQIIRPGAVNWMTAGRGIVHSERTPGAARARGSRLHGLQLWVALPEADEGIEPSFAHHPEVALPAAERDGVTVRVLAGSAFGLASPVAARSLLVLVDAAMPAGTELRLPAAEELAAYVVEGAVHVGALRGEAGRLLVFTPGAEVCLRAVLPARVVLLGGAPLGPRHMDWNFVASDPARIERAKRDWEEGRFPVVPGDEHERVPLPETRRR